MGPMPLSLRLKSLIANSGDAVTIPTTGVTCIVGANNAGKSQILREIRALICDQDPALRCLTAIEAERPTGTLEEAATFLDRTAARHENPSSGTIHYGTDGLSPQTVQEFHQWLSMRNYDEKSGYVSVVGPYFIRSTSAGSLRDYATGSISTGDPVNSSPMSRLFRNGAIEEELSSLAKLTFGLPVVLDRLSPQMILRVGETDVPVPPLNRPTPEYAAAVAALPALAGEGDGLKSFMGFALHALTDAELLMLVDEPEAFLHPAQARALGRWLGKKAKELGAQIVLATHDRDLILGLVEGDAPVNIVRVHRNGTTTHLSQLQPKQVTEVWQNPVLRYSNVLQGLFHAQVIICESDGDCRFFSAALDVLASDRGNPAAADNTLFVPSGGKDRIASIGGSLAALKVHTKAIADFDVLRVRAATVAIVEALGGDWTADMQKDYITVSSAVNKLQPDHAASWKFVKSRGVDALDAGEPYQAGLRLVSALSERGLLVLPKGELEDFDKTLPGHGASWVSDALAKGVHRDENVSKFVAQLL